MDPIIAVDKTTHQLRKVSDVENGIRCNCICSECGGALEACQGEYRQYFRHHSNDRKCTGSWESQLHLLAKYIIEQNKSIALPNWGGKYLVFPARKQEFTDVQVEISQDELKPDCLCAYVDEKGVKKTLWVEILNTHAVDPDKTRKIKERGVSCVEIDVSGLFPDKEIDEEKLKDFLLNSTENRHWINNSEGEKLEKSYIEEAKSIAHQRSLLKFIDKTAKDESQISHFCTILFYYFMSGYELDRDSRVFLCEYVEFYKRRLNFRDDAEKRYFISAIQVLYCCVAQNKNIRWKDGKPKETRFWQYCFMRNLLIKDINGWANDIVSFKKYII